MFGYLLTVDMADLLNADRLEVTALTALVALPVMSCRLDGGLRMNT